ncbi:MAG: cell envelope integrity EipB family protein [Rhodospirillales bacterium]|nr:cell envelope integrity EipB family protein [Rhodospirillales bacterium]
MAHFARAPLSCSGQLRGALFSFILSALVLAVAPAFAVELVPHRAIYKMVLNSAQQGSGINDVQGAMLYRVEEVCDGWTSETKTLMRMYYEGDRQLDSVWSFANWESKDGLSYKFSTRNARDGETLESLKGDVSLKKAGDASTAVFTQPSGLSIPLPKGTMFPTQYLISLIKAAQQGRKFLLKVVFDGSSTDNPFTVNAVIKEIPADQRKRQAESAGLEDRRAWQIWMAFYAVKSKKSAPDFELSVRYREDGVSDFIMQDFGNFSLNITLQDYETLPKASC